MGGNGSSGTVESRGPYSISTQGLFICHIASSTYLELTYVRTLKLCRMYIYLEVLYDAYIRTLKLCRIYTCMGNLLTGYCVDIVGMVATIVLVFYL